MEAPEIGRFSARIDDPERNRGIRTYVDDAGGWVRIVADEILVCAGAPDGVREQLEEFGGERIGFVFESDERDVEIWRIPTSDDPGYLDRDPAARPVPEVVEIARDIRGRLSESDHGLVSPNHVLVPAIHKGHNCPADAPRPTAPSREQEARLDRRRESDRTVDVRIIDAGYIWDATWGDNPLEAGGRSVTVVPAAHLVGGTWMPDPPSVLDADGDRLLDALAGHANFIAGIVGQQCPDARLTIVNHDAGFTAGEDFPTEAAVARSLADSDAADVVIVGFAFHALDSEIGCVWETALDTLADSERRPVVFAPSGNQGDMLPRRYPAALARVVGVGSIKPDVSPPERSDFSNYGQWVDCSAVGEQVHSTFIIAANLEPEDAVPGSGPETFASAWAEWDGTSFATPVVAGRVASILVANPQFSPADAWDHLSNGKDAPTVTTGDVGIAFPTL